MGSAGLKRTALGIFAALCLTLVGPRVGAATDNLGLKWSAHLKFGYDFWIDYKFDTSVPSVYRTYIKNGFGAWNAAGREIYFNNDQAGSSPEILVKVDDLWWPYDGKYGLTQWSTYSGKITSGQIVF